MERLTYVLGLLCSGLSQFLFFLFTQYHTDSTGRSWILFHPESWRWAFFWNLIGLFFIVLGVIADIKDEWRKEEAPPQKMASRNTQKPKEKERVRQAASESKELEDIESEREEPKKLIDAIIRCGNCIKSDSDVQPCEKHQKMWDEFIGKAEEKSSEAPAIWKKELFE